MCRPREVDSQNDKFEIHVKIFHLINSFYKDIWLFQINKKKWVLFWGFDFSYTSTKFVQTNQEVI